MKSELYNGQTLAYIGDGYYELLIREFLIEQGYTKVNELHKKAIKYTSGQSQGRIIDFLLEQNILLEEEINIYKRGRNVHTNQHRKNIDVATYQKATGFEALVGYLYLKNNKERINELLLIIKQLINE